MKRELMVARFMGKAALGAALLVEVSDNQALSSAVVLQVHEGQVLLSNLEQSAVLDLRAE